MKRKAEEREKKAAEKATKVEELAKKRKMRSKQRMAVTSDAGHVPRKKTKTQQKLSRINL